MCYSACTFYFEALRRMTEYLTECSQSFWHYLLVLCLYIRFRSALKHMTECPQIFFRYVLLCLHMPISKALKRMTNTYKNLVAWLMHQQKPSNLFCFLGVLGVAFECWGTFLGPSLGTWMSIWSFLRAVCSFYVVPRSLLWGQGALKAPYWKELGSFGGALEA